MTDEHKFCENCAYYKHTPNILGGIAECRLDVKQLMSFWRNTACDKYKEKKEEAIPQSLMFTRLSELEDQIKSS